MKKIKFKSFDGTELACYLWEVKKPKGMVQIIHGMSEHALRYTRLVKALNDAGYSVFADDHRAHGQTAKEPENVGKYNVKSNLYLDTVKDEIAISTMLRQKYNLPLYVFGHSYGSLILQKYIEDCAIYDKAILCGSSYMNNGLIRLSKVIAKITKAFKGNDAPAKLIENLSFKMYAKGLKEGELWITHDPTECKKYKKDPFCGVPFSAKFYADLMSGVLPVYKRKNLNKINKNKPLMLICGAEDKFSENSKLVKKLYEQYKKLGVKQLLIHIYPDMRHEVHNELNNKQVLDDIIQFFK